MDAFKKFTGGNTQTTGATGTNPQQPGEKKDLGDKIAGFVNKKEGNRASDTQIESGTDKVRGLYEKATGNKVDPKISN
ncbi:hypothetical protein GGS26DRAFT_591447 [Hypomontagnella submonticulosa]|nr:hypothetical protein GGS26DRAFT_591447 [Hypomontagnella submonticulosa]